MSMLRHRFSNERQRGGGGGGGEVGRALSYSVKVCTEYPPMYSSLNAHYTVQSDYLHLKEMTLESYLSYQAEGCFSLGTFHELTF